MLLRDLVARQQFNENIAVKQDQDQITYAELFRSSVYMASILTAKTKPKKNIGIFLPNSIDYVVSYFGITFANMVIVPIDINSKPKEISKVIMQCDINVIISNSNNLKTLFEAIKLLENPITFINTDEIQLADEKQQSYNYENPCSSCLMDEQENEVALMLRTSGTTSTSKSVMLTHRNLIYNIRSNIDTHKLSNKEKTLILLPMYFSYCNTAQFLTHIYLGAEIVIFNKILSGEDIIKTIEKEEITNLNCVPMILQMFDKIESLNEYDLKNLSRIFYGAGFMPLEKLKALLVKFKNIEFIHTYGLTEASPRVSSLFVNKDFCKLGSVGKPLKDIQVKIVSDTRDDKSNNRVGELLVSSEGVTKGYYNDIESSNKIIKDGWLYTGDLAEIDEDGFIYLKGRKKNIINSGGMVIHPEEVEDVLLNYPDIKAAFVYAKKHDLLIEIPVAEIVLHGANNDDIIHKIRKYCFMHLSNHKVPYEIKIVDALEQTSSGKVKRCR